MLMSKVKNTLIRILLVINKILDFILGDFKKDKDDLNF